MKEIELKNLRGKREKHFLKENGFVEAMIYDTNIHYLKNDKYEEIDNTLVEDKKYYTNKANDYKVYFSKISNDELFTIKNNNDYISFSIYNSNLAIAKTNYINKLCQQIEYKNILDGVDIEYIIEPSKVKENIKVYNKESLNNIEFIIKSNLELHIKNDKIISDIFSFDKLFIVDSDNNIFKNIKYQLIKNNNIYKLKFYINDVSNMIFPITIDPTITNRTDENSLIDTYISSTNDINHGYEDKLIAGVDENNVICRTLLKFQLPTIGTGSQIISANLNLIGYEAPLNTFDSEIISVHEMLEPWTEDNARWSNLNNKYNTRVEAIFDSRRSMSNALLVEPISNSADITDLVKKWYSSKINNGIMLKAYDEAHYNNYIPMWYSKNYNIENTNNNPKPLLVITYHNQNGLENYMDYKTINYSKGSSYINTYNGNLTNTFNLVNVVNSKMPFSLNLFYNTNDIILNNNFIAKGYKFNYNQTIKPYVLENDNYLEYLDEDGTLHYFYNNNDDDTYKDEDGLNLKIITNNNQYILNDKNNNKMYFDIINNIGYLKVIEDVQSNRLTITYTDNKITKISNGIDEININYSNSEILITSSAEEVSLNINNELITSINYLEGNIAFTYNNNDLIETVTDINSLKKKFTYYDVIPYRMRKVEEYSILNNFGAYYELTYNYNSTTITDNKDRVNTNIYNNQGNLLSYSNLKSQNNINNAYGNVFEYGDFDPYNNKLFSTSIPLKQVKNYINNSSFENADTIFNNTNCTITRTNECSNTGLYSLKVISNINASISKIVSVESGKHYTASIYLKNTLPVNLSLQYQIENNIVKETNTITDINEEFTRYDVTINYENNESSLSNVVLLIEPSDNSTIYIDDVQLEEGEVRNNYNIIDNSDFSNGINDWTFHAFDSSNGQVLDTSAFFSLEQLTNGKNVLKVLMNPKYQSSFEKRYLINGKAGDSYTISFWYKNEGIVCGPRYGSANYNTVIMNFVYPDNSMGQGINPGEQFYPNTNEWQYYRYTFTALRDYTELRINFFNTKQANSLMITDINLFKDIRNINYEYDEFGNITGSSNYNNSINTYKYDNNNQLINMTNPLGKELTYEYDNEITDRILSGTTDSGISNIIIYDENNNPKTTQIIKNRVSEITPGNYQIRPKGTNKYFRIIDNTFKLSNYESHHDKWIINSSNNAYYIKHSLINNKYLTIDNNNVFLTAFANDKSLFILEEQDNGSFRIKNKENNKYLYLENGIIITKKLSSNDSSFEFFIESSEYDHFIENNATYSENGKYITSTTDTNLKTTYYDIDEETELIRSITNPKGISTNYTYNNDKQLIKATNLDRDVEYSYNSNKLLSKIKQNDKEYTFTYDEFLNTKQIKLNNNTLVTNNYQENNGNLDSIVYGNNQIVSYEYDDFDRISKQSKMDNVYHYKYDNNNNLVKLITDDTTTYYEYDEAKRLRKYKDKNYSINYTYDNNDNIVIKTYKLGTQTHQIIDTLNDDELVIKTTIDNNEIDYTYDYLGRLISKDNVNYTYKHNGKRETLLLNSIDNISYDYDKLNNIIRIKENDNIINKYKYDSYNQLIEDINYLNNTITKYLYDNNGNITLKKVIDITTNQVLEQNTYEYNNSSWLDQLTKFNNETISYDAIGNPLTIGNKTLTWINGRQLNSYSDTLNSISYKYNVKGIRTSKIINNIETKYYLDGINIIFEQTGNNMLYYIYSNVDNLIGFKYNDDTYYYIKNGQDDIISIKDTNNNIIARYEYDSFGNTLSIKDNNGIDISNNQNHIANINPFRYRSYYYDKETNLYYLNSRYYNPVWGRFINADGIIAANNDIISHNLYQYCSNDPINKVDKLGLFFIKRLCNKTINWIKKNVAIEANANIQKKESGIDVGIVKDVVNSYFGESVTIGNSNAKIKILLTNNNNNKYDSTLGLKYDSTNFSVSIEGGLLTQAITATQKNKSKDDISITFGQFFGKITLSNTYSKTEEIMKNYNITTGVVNENSFNYLIPITVCYGSSSIEPSLIPIRNPFINPIGGFSYGW